MKTNFFKCIVVATITTTCLASCIKDEVKPLKDEGDAFLKLTESPENNIYFEPFKETKKVGLFTIARDAANQGQLTSTANVKLTMDNSLITAYNTAHNSSFEVLPDSLYSLGTGITRQGNVFTIPLLSGDFAKSFEINLNGSKWDVSKKYAMAFKVTDSAGMNISEGFKEIIAFLSIKNKYDADYSATGYFYHPSLPRSISMTHKLTTAGPNSVTLDVETLGTSGYRALITIDESTNKVTVTAAPGATASPYTMFTEGLPTTNPGYTAAWGGSSNIKNTYDPATKTFYIRYGYVGGGGWRVIEEVLTKK